jgi:hypothetical protein
MTNNEHLDQINHIKKMMEENSKFLSLSGLSGVFAGVTALVGAFFAYGILTSHNINPFGNQMRSSSLLDKSLYLDINDYNQMVWELVIVAVSVFAIAIIGGFIFTYLKVKKEGASLWTSSTRRLLINLAIPLFAGGMMGLAFIKDGNTVYIAPISLIFYGLALLNASKYTLRDIRYLAICEVLLGILGMFFLGYGFIFWIIGFGFLHILYGVIMYFKYDRK